jgi:hypothetical protein
MLSPVQGQDLAEDLAFLQQAAEQWQPTYPELPGPVRELPPVDWRDIAPAPPPTPPLQAGPYTLQPAITAGAFFDDNVFASNSGRRSDWAYFLRPELGWRWRGPQHLFEGLAHLEVKRYAHFESENQLTGGVALGGTIQADRDTQFHGRMRYARGQESRGSGESVFQQFEEPVSYDQFELAASLNHRRGRNWVSLGGGASWVRYGTPTIGGVPIDQSYRDGVVSVVSGRAGYVVAPLTSVFFDLSANRRDFEVDAFDSKGFRAVVGALLEPGRGARVRGEVNVGVMHQNYVGATFETISTWTFGGALAIQSTPQLTTTLIGRREAKESALNGGGSLIETLAGLRFDYQVNPKFTVGAGISYLVHEYIGGARTDRTWNPLFAAKYLLTPNLTLAFDYRYLSFDSTGLGALGYGRNVYLLAVNGRF